MQAQNRRISALEVSVDELRTGVQEALHLLRRMDSRPPRVIEYRQDTRRLSEGGQPVRVQRKKAGVPKRAPRARLATA
jgi:hypothetical protein